MTSYTRAYLNKSGHTTHMVSLALFISLTVSSSTVSLEPASADPAVLLESRDRREDFIKAVEDGASEIPDI